MEKRFGFRDLVICVLLAVLIVTVWLAMKQRDRQGEQLRSITVLLQQQTAAQARMERALGDIGSTLETATVVHRDPSTASPPTTPSAADPFDRLRAARAKPDFAAGDWVIDAFPARVARITPLISADWYASRIQGRVLETLADRDPDTLQWQPILAESWRIQNNSAAWQEYVDRRVADGESLRDIINDPDVPAATVITFRLRRGITFSDGEPLTAEDVQYSYDLTMNEQIDAPRIRNLIRDKIKSVKATDRYEVRFEFKAPYYNSFGMAAATDALPKHFYSRFSPEQINSKPGLLMGSGPYRMRTPTDWAPGKPLELLRNERYWGLQPAFDRLVYREINNEIARLAAFNNGETDLFYRALPEQYLDLKANKELMERSRAFEAARPIDGYGFIAWNERKGNQPTPFADRRVRQAMTMLTNRQQIIGDVLHGLGSIPTGPFNRLSNQYNQQVTAWSYNQERAIELLREAGYEDRDGDGVLEGADAEPLIFKYTFPTQQGGQGFWDRVGLLLKDHYAEAGIVMELDPLEWSVFHEKIKSRDFDALSMAWTAGIESDIYQMFHSDNIGQGADNFVSYANPKLDELIDRARATVDEDLRMPLWQSCHEILHEDQPYTFLYTRNFLMVVDSRYQNIEKIKIGINDRSEWYVPRHLQKY